MIPAIVAEELKATLLDYLDTTFSFHDVEVARSLQSFLAGRDEGIFKGPFVSLQLPYRRDPSGRVDDLLDIRPPFQPYTHQTAAFELLSSKGSHRPVPTLVTTGTGSGKTECFIYPVLDHCYRQIGKPGIKSIILYPMNALAADQANRIARIIWNDPRLKNRITVGMYVGGKGSDRTMGPDNVITDRDTLRSHPPDILLTNYKMLDFLLLRPEDQRLWKETGPESVRYLVLDELHTYDGAQGSDVACLIRRLKAKLRSTHGSLCCVGTSATLAGDAESSKRDLIEFASLLFGEAFHAYSVVSQTHESMEDYLSTEEIDEIPRDMEALTPIPGDDIARFIARQCQAWFGKSDLTAVEIGVELRRHGFLRTVLRETHGKIVGWDDLVQGIARWDNRFGDLSPVDRDILLQSFLSLINFSRRMVGERKEPFLNCQIQFWVRAMSRLMREVTPTPTFFWRDDPTVSPTRHGLPAIYCRECGHTGWVSYKRVQDVSVEDDHVKIYQQFMERSRHLIYLFPGTDESELFRTYLCPSCLALGNERRCTSCQVDGISVQAEHSLTSTATQPRSLQRCPACETDFSLTILGSQAASLSSVAISHMYQTRFIHDDEKKLLAFTDSVQDASHRAGFFGARTYRFNLRTAIQAILENEPTGEISLQDFASRMLAYWKERIDRSTMIATFMPPDLSNLLEYREYMRAGGKSDKVLQKLRKRLSWEIAMEFGFNARVGRTLDKVRCSTARLNEQKLEPALAVLFEKLTNEFEMIGPSHAARIRHFVVGLLTRTRIRGGVSHEFLKAYADEQGNWYHLTRERQELISPFSSDSRRPRFLSLLPNERVFDSFITSGNRRTWYLDWARRSLDDNLDGTTTNDIYRTTVEVLKEHGLLELIGKKNNTAYSMPQDALIITRNTVPIRSDRDGHSLTIAADDLIHWEGMPSLFFRGDGVYRQDDVSEQSYYRNIYRSGSVKRIFCQEHSGLLDREKREEVESEFRTRDRADAPNLLTCTPTLEMGIDVGDLSSTMLCSIPPSPTNYLQRIGRAGRSTGNALVLAIANVRPHDLYFFDDPFEMIAGAVIPPGCFLDAPEMLKRQYVGFCLDCWCSDDPNAKSMPTKVMNLLAQNRKGDFPQNFLSYVAARRQDLFDRFKGLFEGVIAEASWDRIRDYALSEELTQGVNACLARTEESIEQIRRFRQRVKERHDKLDQDPNPSPAVEEERKSLGQEMSLLVRMIRQIQEKYPLNLFTDEGILPNYAFPETGVKLRSVIYGMKEPDNQGGSTTTSRPFEYLRGASTAIRELAPFNTFYAENRKVMIDQVETGGRNHSLFEEWIFCDRCTHMEIAAQGSAYKTCPTCGSAGWVDVGQRRMLLRMSQVSARTKDQSSHTSDESDDRQRQSYILKDFIDVQPENWGGAFADAELPFGIEYLKKVTLREINFGLTDVLSQKMRAAGEQIPDGGFGICRDCGVVRDPRSNKRAEHRPWCYYNQPNRTEEFLPTFIYRQVESEAIRILLPVSTFEAETDLATFKACLELGLRKAFKGNPSHLIIRQHTDPGKGGDAASRQFLVLFDIVPGGTGYLKEFAQNPASLRKLLEAAFKTLKSCSCRHDEKKHADGCYRCVYAFQRQFELGNISRERGVELLSKILERWDSLQPIETLTHIDLPDLLVESELERRFRSFMLKTAQQEKWKPKKLIRNGAEAYEFAIGGRHWIMESQVKLGKEDGVLVPSQPDFVLRPAQEDNDVLPIAVFTDGFAYHAMPEDAKGRIADDVQKRSAIIQSGRFLVWSVTWDDVVEAAKDRHDPTRANEPSLFADLSLQVPILTQMLKTLSSPLTNSILGWTSLDALIAYLREPVTAAWRQAVGAMALLTMAPTPPFREIEDLEETAAAIRSSRPLLLPSLPESDGNREWIGRVHTRSFLSLFLYAPSQAANRFEHGKFRVLLRLEDDADCRTADGFKEAWRKFLITANWLQFLSGFEWLSRELLLTSPIEGMTKTKQSVTPELPKEVDRSDEIRELLELSDTKCHELIQECALKGKPLPIVGFAMGDANGIVVAEAELAWETPRVAVLLADSQAAQEAFTSAGWTVFIVDDVSINTAPVLRAIGE